MLLRSVLLVVAALALLVSPARGQGSIPSQDLESAVIEAYNNGEYEKALKLIERFLESSPTNVEMLYNGACLHCRLGHRDEAATYLYRAVEAGFRDFALMKRDVDLKPLHDHPTFKAILEASERVGPIAADDALQRWKTEFGVTSYRYETDDKRRRVAYATALDEQSHKEMRQMLERQADQIIATLIDEAPSYYILVAVPTPADARKIFGGDEEIGGIYQHAQRRLVARDIGSTLRHEFFHAMHYSQMQRLGQRHRLWVQEGIAALYEDYELTGGTIKFLPNRRHNIARRRARSGRTMKWSRLFELSSEDFMRKAGHLYPQVRSMFEYVADRGRLEQWYDEYIEHFDEDDSGIVAFESVFSKPIEAIERDWRKWVIARGEVDVDVDFGDASLGIETGFRSSNDGVLIERVIRGSSAGRGGLRQGDVIVSIDGRDTRSLPELRAVVATRSIGDRVTVRFRRNGAYETAVLVLRPLTPEPTRFR